MLPVREYVQQGEVGGRSLVLGPEYLWLADQGSTPTAIKTIKVEISDELDLDQKEILTLLASKLYEQGRLSLGQAAELAGFTKRTFAELLSRYKVSIFNFPSLTSPGM